MHLALRGGAAALRGVLGLTATAWLSTGQRTCLPLLRAGMSAQHRSTRLVQQVARVSSQAKAATPARQDLKVHAVSTAESYDLATLRHNLMNDPRIRVINVANELAREVVCFRFVGEEATDQPESSQDAAVSPAAVSADTDSTTRKDLTSNAEAEGEVFVFRLGTVIFWNLDKHHLQLVRQLLQPVEKEPITSVVAEEEHEIIPYRYSRSDEARVAQDTIVLRHPTSQAPDGYFDATAEHLRTKEKWAILQKFAVSHGLALSVSLGVLEAEIIRYANRVEWIPQHIREGKTLRITRNQVLQRVGELLVIRHKLNTLQDFANFYWDREDLEKLKDRVCNFLDVTARRRICNERLTYHTELADLLRTTSSEAHSTKLEWYVIGLIAIEVVFEFVHYLSR